MLICLHRQNICFTAIKSYWVLFDLTEHNFCCRSCGFVCTKVIFVKDFGILCGFCLLYNCLGGHNCCYVRNVKVTENITGKMFIKASTPASKNLKQEHEKRAVKPRETIVVFQNI